MDSMKSHFLSTHFSDSIYTNSFPHSLDIVNLKSASHYTFTLKEPAAYVLFDEQQRLPVEVLSHETADDRGIVSLT